MGLVCSLLSAVFATTKDLVSKRLSFNLDGTTSTFASFAFALPYYGVALAVLGYFGLEQFTLSWTFLWLVVLRALTDSLAEAMKMHAFSHGDISIVATFFSLAPLFLLITSPLLTGDPVSPSEVVAVVLVVIGSALLVYRPTSSTWTSQRKGILLACAASVFFGLNSCFDRLAVMHTGASSDAVSTPVFAAFAMTLLSAVLILPFMIGRPTRMLALRDQQAGLWVRGFFEIAFMSAKLYALQYWTAPSVVGMQRVSLVLSIIGGRIFFKEEDFARRLAAGLLILVGAFLIGDPSILWRATGWLTGSQGASLGN